MFKNMKYIILLLVAVLCGCAENNNKKTISVAVTGSPSSYSRYYEQGIKKAYAMLCKEYPDYNIVCEFYDDKDDYATAEQITSKLVNDESVTAILASSSPEICENQAYRTNKSNKLLVCPHWIYDDTLTETNYDNVFSINHSSEQIGYAMGVVAEKSSAQKWAVCYSDDKISNLEKTGFGNDVNIVDSMRISSLKSEFNKTIERWKLLGVDGVVLIPYDYDFDFLYKLKNAMPDITVISDSSLDDTNELENNRDYFNNVYIVDSFFTSNENSKVFDYKNEEVDTWEIHGYNALRMVVDTAVKNNTVNPKEIAKALHSDGYNGELENFLFDTNGSLISKNFTFTEIKENDIEAYEFAMNEG